MIYRKIISRNPSCSLDWVAMEPVSHLLYLPLCVPRAPPARVLKWGVSLRVPGADSPSLGEVVLRPLTAPSRLLSPRLGDLRARHASATAGWVQEQVRWCNSSEVTVAVPMLTCDWTVVFIKVNAHASSLPSADAATPSTTQRDGHHAVHVGQHDGHADTWQTHRVQFYSPVYAFSSLNTTSVFVKLSMLHLEIAAFWNSQCWRMLMIRFSYPRWQRRLPGLWWSTGPLLPWWPGSSCDETTSSDHSEHESVATRQTIKQICFGNPHLMSHEAKINETLLPFLVTSTFILKSIFIF